MLRSAGIRAFASLLIVAMSGCGDGHEHGHDHDHDHTHHHPEGDPVIVTSIWPLADLAGQIVGGHAKVICLVPAGTSPHGYEPTSRDIKSMTDAHVLLVVGMHFDDWAAEGLRKVGNKHAHVWRFSSLVGLEEDDEHAHHDHGHEHAHEQEPAKEGHDHAHDHDHSGPNPHLWLDPVLAKKFVTSLSERLAKELPDAAEEISGNAKSLSESLDAIDSDYREGLMDHKGSPIVTYHNAFDRLAERYGLSVAATLTPIDSPSALTKKRIDAARDAIRSNNLKVLFTEPQFPPDAAKALERETGVRVLVLDPLGHPGSDDRASYQQLMRYNLRVLLAGLAGEAPSAVESKQ